MKSIRRRQKLSTAVSRRIRKGLAGLIGSGRARHIVRKCRARVNTPGIPLPHELSNHPLDL